MGEQSPRALRRICLVVRDEPGVTGTSRYAERLAAGLVERGFEVVTSSTRPGGGLSRGLALGRRLGVDLGSFLATYPQRLRWPPADLYHLTVQTYAGALAAGRPAAPVLTTVHDVIPYATRADAELSVLRHRPVRWANERAVRALALADRLIVPSAWTRDEVTRHLALPAERIDVVPLAVDAAYRPLPVPAELRRRYGLEVGRPHLLYVGSEDPRKNLEQVWRALALVLRQRPAALLLKVGATYDERRRRALVELASSLGIGHAVRFVGAVPEPELPYLYAAADVLLMPSLLEGFGLPVLEAMACGTPVVTTDRAALAELANAQVASVVDPGNSAAIAGAVLQLLAEPAHAAAQSERARRWAAGFSWQRTIDGTVAAYYAALRARQQPAADGAGRAAASVPSWRAGS